MQANATRFHWQCNHSGFGYYLVPSMPSNRSSSRRRRSRGQVGNEEEVGNDEEQIYYGLRRTRRETSWEYRDSSSLSPRQMMEREDYLQLSSWMLVLSILAGHAFVLLANRWRYYNSSLLRWTTIRNGISHIMEASIERVRILLARCKESIDRLYFAIKWMLSHGEIAWLYAEDLSIYVRRRHRFKPVRNRTINDINRRDCYTFFGINPNQLRLLFIHWRIPQRFIASNRKVFTGEECFIIYLYHLMRGYPFTEMARLEFGGDPRHFTYMVNAMNDHLYETFYHKNDI